MCGNDTCEDLNLTPATEASRACCSNDAETPAPADASGMACRAAVATAGYFVMGS